MAQRIDPYELLLTWRRRFTHLKRSHYRSCSYFEIRNRVFAVITIIFAASAPPLTYVATKLNLESEPVVLIFGTLVAALAGMLATLQIFFRDSERAERHRVAGATYAKLEGDTECVLAFPPGDEKALLNEVEKIRDEWTRLTGASPVIPEWLFRKVEREIEVAPQVHQGSSDAKCRTDAHQSVQPDRREDAASG
jgi:hypothetical protein